MGVGRVIEVHRHFKGCCRTWEGADEVEEEEPEFFIVQPAVHVEDLASLTATQKRIATELLDIGFECYITQSVTHHRDTFFDPDGKSARAGELKKAEHDQEHIFMCGQFPNSFLAYYCYWLDGKFSAMVMDPVGKFVTLGGSYEPSKEMREFLTEKRALEYQAKQEAEYNDGWQERVTRWTIDGSTEFERWLDEWRKLIKGKSRAEEREEAKVEAAQKAQERLDKKREKQNTIYRQYLEEEGVEYDEDSWA